MSPPPRRRGLFFAAIHVLLLDDNSNSGRGGTKGLLFEAKTCRLLSFKEVQLVSLRLCKECRTIGAFHIKIARGTPRRLWAGPTCTRETDRGGRWRGRGGSLDGSRVPPMRVTEITWERAVRELGEGRQVGLYRMCGSFGTFLVVFRDLKPLRCTASAEQFNVRRWCVI